MRVQTILAHPLPDSFAAAVHRTAADTLRDAGHEVAETDLYAQGFEPALTAAERAAYHRPDYDTTAVAPLVERLRWADALVLVYPHWWFDMPAIMKGYFDRVWAPGVAFRHDPAGGTIRPLLTNLRHVAVLTSFGSPWWINALGLRHPSRRILRVGVVGACAPKARFHWRALYDMDRSTPDTRARFLAAAAADMRRLG
ncbi:NAD(P)H-dependent oxidoreductase [Azospirillum sp. RWY-5-1]|uniref:NAD(P)H-dependent oxidoreductase n=1 Tax=Azospirillum oleiclasticum TaxID=2735135 RepID=A0ABX2TDL4_9PROT|nr:NAD(P)H-dependent oxidoreductase [Azospirillum oleiclasticum]NYZ15287.1 NAD(P)H-dependent oxidoreductase [Azospirillum oleiclasticum]NYZ21292.1 NAD(P)H-dependent oxidoreductase [Azospirillum oleiclasticum]